MKHIKDVLMDLLKVKAKEENKLADEHIAAMVECDNRKSLWGSRNHSDQAKIHRYAAQEFRKILKSLEKN